MDCRPQGGKEKECFPMAKVKYIASLAEIPTDQKYVLVKFGEE